MDEIAEALTSDTVSVDRIETFLVAQVFNNMFVLCSPASALRSLYVCCSLAGSIS